MQIERNVYLNKLIARKHNGFVKVITGIRRCGKSYLLNRLMVVLKNGLLLYGVLYTVLDLVRGLLRLEVYQTAGVLPVFEDMNKGRAAGLR